jgi:trk system potassium uptake protein
MRRIHSKLTQTQMIVVGFMLIILTGSLLLMLPWASRSHEVTPFLDTLFTATSASCVTGLVVVDTWSHWSMFGQVIILILIQVGGMGFMTLGVFMAILLRRRIGLKTRGVLQESINSLQIGGIVKLAKKIIQGTVFFESVGALILMYRFIPKVGMARGIWYGIFHSVSAFCNAGFDLMGYMEPYESLCGYAGDWLVNLTIMSLIVIGGIGFFVWDDIATKKLKVHRYTLHTKLVLMTTLALIIGGALFFFFTEQSNVLRNMPFAERIWASFFQSVTARTAGFNTVDTGALTEGSKFVTILLMFVGGSPGSTAGGIKTTTLIVLLVCVRSNMRQEKGYNILDRRLDEAVVRKACTVMCTNLLLMLTATIVMLVLQPFALTDVLFETASAIGTVGMTTGITRSICSISKAVLIFLMYCGRIGSLTFALSLRGNKHEPAVKQPVEQVMIG